MTLREELERRILIKRQLIELTLKEIRELEEKLEV